MSLAFSLAVVSNIHTAVATIWHLVLSSVITGTFKSNEIKEHSKVAVHCGVRVKSQVGVLICTNDIFLTAPL